MCKPKREHEVKFKILKDKKKKTEKKKEKKMIWR